MITCKDYLEACKAKLGLVSDYALAAYFGVPRASISNYQRNRTSFDDPMAIRVAEVLEIDPELVIAAAHFERAKNESEKAIWERMFDKLSGLSDLGKAAGIGLVIGIAGISYPSETHAQGQNTLDNNINYAKQ